MSIVIFVVGLGFSILTYDNRFHIGLAVDTAVLQIKDDAQEICDGIFKYIKYLHQELFGFGLPSKGTIQH